MPVIRVVLITIMLGLAGCAGVSRNADCQFPLDEIAPTAVLDQGLLDREALLAEDLAIRFADRTAGPRSKWPLGREGYRTVREQCMGTLFDIVGRRHGVSVAQVREALTHRGMTFDGVVLISFLGLYALAANSILRRILSGSLGQNALSATLAVAGASLAVAPIGALAWTVWSGIAETIRLGNGHASYRVARIPWRQHPVEIVLACLVLFCLVALYRSWTPRRSQQALRVGRS
jgi:hypothetical protein